MTQADAEDRGSADHNVELYLSGRKDDRERTDGIRHLALGVLQREAAAAERTTVLSAYYVCDVLNDLLGACRGGRGDSHAQAAAGAAMSAATGAAMCRSRGQPVDAVLRRLQGRAG